MIVYIVYYMIPTGGLSVDNLFLNKKTAEEYLLNIPGNARVYFTIQEREVIE